MNPSELNEDLVRYCDLEMTPEQRMGFEKKLAQGAELSHQLEQIQKSDRLLRAWNFQIDSEPKPEITFIQPETKPLASERPRTTTLPLALAASLVTLGIGLSIGLNINSNSISNEQVVAGFIGAKKDSTLQTALETAPSYQPVSWENNDGERGEATVTRTWQLESGNYCREYTYVYFEADGSRSTEQGAACRSEDGKWKVKLKIYPSGNEVFPVSNGISS